ncbi:unnamed protein product [Closterium sp. NIES-64]|nr:unnamed protein product [Closterium sp. NIES-64]
MWDVFRPHILDWVVFVLITAGSIALDSVHPFQQFVNADYMQKYMYPLKPDSVPFWAVPVYAFGFPLLAMTVSFILRRDFIDFHSSLLGYVFNCATTFLLTNALKVSIGRPRPHFFIVCFPSGVPVYGSDGNVQCNGSSSSVMESRVSFPSGHTSTKLQAFSARGRGQLWRLVPSACCLAGAASVGITRIDDYWHFPFDVFIGGLIVDDYWHFPFDVFVGGLIGRPPLHVLCAVLFVSREWMTTGTSPFDDFMEG